MPLSAQILLPMLTEYTQSLPSPECTATRFGRYQEGSSDNRIKDHDAGMATRLRFPHQRVLSPQAGVLTYRKFEVIDIPKMIYTDPTLFPCSNELIPKKIFSHHLGMHFTEHVTCRLIGNQEMRWF
jgi:hypothetical protein